MSVRVPATSTASWQSLSLLLVEDDRADAVLVEDLIADGLADIRVVWAQSMAHAERELASARPDCVLLDLNLPDATGMDALDRIARRDATVPIVVLTGLNDEFFGASAVAAGAQDYLVKGRVEPEMLRRALMYAIERKRAELISADLHASQLRARENALLERGLLPSPLLLDNPGVDIVARYRPSREDALLCGDFYDVVQTPGPDRPRPDRRCRRARPRRGRPGCGTADRVAYAHLRRASMVWTCCRSWSGCCTPNERAPAIFATVLTLEHPAAIGERIKAIRAGHPGMLLQGAGAVQWIEPPAGPALGLRAGHWPQHEVELPAGHGLMLLTDGLYEGYSGRGRERLGEDGSARAGPHACRTGRSRVCRRDHRRRPGTRRTTRRADR